MNRIVILSSLILVGCSTYNGPANHSCNLKKIYSSIAFNSLDKNWTEIDKYNPFIENNNTNIIYNLIQNEVETNNYTIEESIIYLNNLIIV